MTFNVNFQFEIKDIQDDRVVIENIKTTMPNKCRNT